MIGGKDSRSDAEDADRCEKRESGFCLHGGTCWLVSFGCAKGLSASQRVYQSIRLNLRSRLSDDPPENSINLFYVIDDRFGGVLKRLEKLARHSHQ